MDKHPIENIMTTTMENIRDMIDVNTVVGDAIHTPDGSTVIPVSRVSFGFVAGGGEYGSKRQTGDGSLPFAGGAGTGVTVQPVAFLVSSCGCISLLPARQESPAERLIALAPQALCMLRDALEKKCAKGNKACSGSFTGVPSNADDPTGTDSPTGSFDPACAGSPADAARPAEPVIPDRVDVPPAGC